MNLPNKIGIILILLLGWGNALLAQSDSVQATPNGLMTEVALSLLNIPYEANTLEGNEEERLVVNLEAMDCLTFVENCLALSHTLLQHFSSDTIDFARHLQYIRYRNGIILGYTSRLHYMTDWIANNIKKGVVEDLTNALGGKKFQPQVNFMSSHPELYPALRENPQEVETMKKIEKAINQRQNYYYIPTHEIKEKQSRIKSGDIVCFTTNRPGLDISHIGIAYWHKSQLTFIHASAVQKKVIINPESLVDYCGRIKNNTGIMVLRPLLVNRDTGLSL